MEVAIVVVSFQLMLVAIALARIEAEVAKLNDSKEKKGEKQ